VLLFDLANGQSRAIDTSPDERLSSPMLRPATPGAATPPAR
jgi:hypothetical protein